MKKLLLAGALLCSAGLASALLLPVGNEIVLTTQEATQENLLPVSGFDDADFSQTFTSGVFNQWVTHSASSETNPITMSVVEDSERGLVASYDGRPYSWYTSVIAQRVEELGICTAQEFIQECQTGTFDYTFLENLPDRTYRLEGYLFPDTYYFEEGATARERNSQIGGHKA